MANYYKGRYILKNPSKYSGNRDNITYRSSWELKMMNYLDNNRSIIEWNSEEIVIPYLSPIDGKFHRYYTDFYAKIKDSENNIKKYLIEVKPRKERSPPRKNKNKARYIKEAKTYVINQAKWEAAEMWCKKKGWEFKIIDETDLGIR